MLMATHLQKNAQVEDACMQYASCALQRSPNFNSLISLAMSYHCTPIAVFRRREDAETHVCETTFVHCCAAA